VQTWRALAGCLSLHRVLSAREGEREGEREGVCRERERVCVERETGRV